MTQTFHNWLFPNTKTNEMLVTTMWETKHARLKRCSRFYLTALPVSCDTRHVFPPPQSAHGLTLSQTNWSFLCEYRTFNPSETWHAVLSSMNASLLDLSLCCVLGGQQGDVLVLHPAGWRPPLDAAPSLTRPGEELVRHPRTVTVTTLCFCLFTNADYNLCFISCITEFSWICWHCTGGGGGGWCCMPLHSYLGLFV